MLTISLLTGMKNSCKRGYIIFDRIDLQVEVESVPFEDIAKAPKGESSAAIRERVLKARQIQNERYKDVKGVHCNAQMTTSLLQKYVQLDDQALNLLRTAMKKFNLSARAYDRILKVSRTIADLEGAENVQSHHIAEAIGYRNLDRDNWVE
ncbi:MAG: ATP-binding protein [Bacteroidaceae bacterium]|nr:ATP-binding protein [Bacteroidaceae bacterium]